MLMRACSNEEGDGGWECVGVREGVIGEEGVGREEGAGKAMY